MRSIDAVGEISSCLRNRNLCFLHKIRLSDNTDFVKPIFPLACVPKSLFVGVKDYLKPNMP